MFGHFAAARVTDVQTYPTPRGVAARYLASWKAPDQHEMQHQGVVVFSFTDGLIDHIGVVLDDERFRELLH